MDVVRVRYVVSERGQAAMESLPAGLERLTPTALATELRRAFAPAEAAALAEQVTLRAAAHERWGETPVRFFARESLEMMTHPIVARRRAAWLARLGLPVVDLGCGLGGDSRAMLDAGAYVVGIERDPAVAMLGSANLNGRVVQGDAARPPVEIAPLAVFIDPSRREGGKRRFDPAAFSPRWDVAMHIAESARAAVVKAPPGIDHAQIPTGAEAEFVQLGRTMREAALWFGGDAEPGLRRAVLLPAGIELRSDAEEVSPECIPPAGFIADPESCVTRAGLVRRLAALIGGRLMDPQVAYLALDEPAAHPMAATFEVLERVPFSVARLRDLLRARGWRADEIRRRAFPVEPDELRKLLGKMVGEPVALLCTTIGSERVVFVARRADRNVGDL